MKKYLLLILILFISSCSLKDTTKVCFENKCINAEVRDTPQSRNLGLMFREELNEDEGMLFIFEKSSNYSFWMKNMKIYIDMIWLDENKKIVHIETKVPPCVTEECPTYSPQSEALYVVETVSGFSSKYELEIGQEVDFK